VEVVGDLEIQDRIVDFLSADPFDVFLGGNRVGILVVVRDPSAEGDALQVQTFVAPAKALRNGDGAC
jgi:hypothetical protein